MTAASLEVHSPRATPARAGQSSDTGETLQTLLEHPEAKARIAPLLSPGDDYERIVAVIGRAARQNPEILDCTGTSILDAAATIVGWRLEIGETAFLVPFNVNITPKAKSPTWEKRCTPIMGYTGMCQLLIASGAARYVEPWCVYANEQFEVIGGSESRIEHRPSAAADRTALKGAYVIVHLRFGARAFKWMPIEDIDAIRTTRSKKWKEGPCPPWYAMKTVIRQMAKLLPKTREVAKAFAFIQDEEAAELTAPVRLDELEPTPQRPALEAGAGADDRASAPVAAPEAEAPAISHAAPSPEPEREAPRDPGQMTLDEALAVRLRGAADKWGGHGSKPLSDVPPSVLAAAHKFFSGKLAERPDDADLAHQVAALALVHLLRLDEAERDQIKLAFDQESEGDAEGEVLPATDVAISARSQGAQELTEDETVLRRMSAAQLQATAIEALKDPACKGVRAGFLEQINSGTITHHQLVRTVAMVAGMILAARQAKEERRKRGEVGELPGGA